MRQPKPFFRKQTQSWYVQLGRRQISLGRDCKQAWQAYHELMAREAAVHEHPVTVAELCELYLEWCQQRRDPGTYEKNRRYVRSFVDEIGRRFPISKLRPFHISDWLSQHPTWTETTQNDAVSCVQRPFNWAIKQGRLDRNPIAQLEDKPRRKRREVAYSPEQWSVIQAAVKDINFRDLLTFLWETGCRPQEARRLEGRHVDLRNGMVIYPPSESKGQQHERVIYLSATALEIVRLRCERYAEGPLFRNARGNPWTKDAIKCRLSRIKANVKIPVLCAYGIRHSFATEGLKNGVDSVTLAALMGHSDLAMVARTYQHLARNPQFLREQAERARGA